MNEFTDARNFLDLPIRSINPTPQTLATTSKFQDTSPEGAKTDDQRCQAVPGSFSRVFRV